MFPTTIMLADDHPVVRLGLRTLLEKEPDFQIVAEAFDGLEAVRMARQCRPDVLVLDLMMPGMSGVHAISELKREVPETHIIVLSMQAGDGYAQESFRRGAEGYVVKDNTADEIVSAIRTVLQGRSYQGDGVPDAATAAETEMHTGKDSYETLTLREREVFYHLAKGLRNKEVADVLGISVRTVEVHRARVMRKLNCSNQAHLAQFAMQWSLI